MPALHQNFDATQIAPRDNTPLPVGEYLAMIVASQWKSTKAGDGQYLEIELQVVDGPHAGRKLWDRLNLQNRNPKAEEIAQRTLSAICHAVDRLQVQDSEMLHNLPLVVRVAHEDGIRGVSAVIKDYKSVQRQGAPAASPQSAPPAPAAPAATVTRPAAAAAAGAKPAWAR